MSEAPVIYDISIDERRPVTQKDADRWVMQGQIIGQLFRGQDAVKTAYISVLEEQISWDVFSRALNDFEKAVGIVRNSWPIDPASLMACKLPHQGDNWMGES